MKIGIIGSGWLGNQVRNHFIAKRTEVFGTSRNAGGPSLSPDLPCPVFQYQTDFPEQIHPPLREGLSEVEYLIVCLPPSALADPESLTPLLSHLNPHAKIIYTSSTGIYSGLNGRIDESSELNTHLIRVLKLKSIEDYFSAHYINSLVILRLGGLIGPGRNPANFFKKTGVIPNPEGITKMIHSTDVVQLIDKLTGEFPPPGIYNLVNPGIIRRKAFYDHVFKLSGRPTPTYSAVIQSEKTQIVVDKVLVQLKFDFHFANLLQTSKIDFE